MCGTTKNFEEYPPWGCFHWLWYNTSLIHINRQGPTCRLSSFFMEKMKTVYMYLINFLIMPLLKSWFVPKGKGKALLTLLLFSTKSNSSLQNSYYDDHKWKRHNLPVLSVFSISFFKSLSFQLPYQLKFRLEKSVNILKLRMTKYKTNYHLCIAQGCNQDVIRSSFHQSRLFYSNHMKAIANYELKAEISSQTR